MSFLSNVFSGASNNFTPMGTNPAIDQTKTANANYAGANTGLNTLASMLQTQAAGGGPNPALAQLAQSTGQNVSQQAALQAGQRGASGNVGLMARQIGQTGAGIQQQSAGQAAIQRAQQQLAAQGQLGQVYGTQGSLANQNYGISQGAVTSANQIGSQQGQQNAQMNQGLIGGAANAIGSVAGLFADGGQANPPPPPPPIDPTKAKSVQDSFKGALGFADGGETNIAPGLGSGSNFGFNFVNGKSPGDSMATANNNLPVATDQFKQLVVPSNPSQPSTMSDNDQLALMRSHTGSNGGAAGMLPFSPPQSTKPMGAMMMNSGGVLDVKQGGTIPGEPRFNHNTIKNDTVPAMLTPKEIVLPIEVTQHPDAPAKAAEFVARELRKNGHDSKQSDFKGAIKRGMEARRKK